MSSLTGASIHGKRSRRRSMTMRRLVHRERRLRDVGQRRVGGEVERVDLRRGLHEHDRVGRLAHRAHDLLVARVADEQDRVAALREAAGLAVHLRHERTGGVDDREVARLRVLVHRRCDAVGREDDRGALGHVELRVDEDRAAPLQLGHDVRVVHDLLAHVDRLRARELERALDRLDRPVDARAVAARRREDELEVRHRPHGTRVLTGWQRVRRPTPSSVPLPSA